MASLIFRTTVRNLCTINMKKQTGLTGYEVVKYPHKTLRALYNKTLKALDQMPKEAAYRQYTEAMTVARLQIVETEPDIAKLEEKVNSGQIEELIRQAQRELELARNMIEWKPWEPLMAQAPDDQWRWPTA